MDRFNEPPYDGFDFQITAFDRNNDGTADAHAKCDNGAYVDVDMKLIDDDGEALIEAYVSVGYGQLGSSGRKYIEPSNKIEISLKDAEECIRVFMQESMDLE